MALISYLEDSTAGTFSVGCFGAGSTGDITAAVSMATSSTPPGAGPTGEPSNNGTDVCISLESTTAPGASATWDAGNWVVTINHLTCDAGTQLQRVDICDNNGGSYTNVVSNYDSTGDHSRGGTGEIVMTINQSGSHSPQSAANSIPYIVFTYNTNEAHGGHTAVWTTAWSVDTPIDDGAAAGGGYTGALSMMGVG